MDTADALRLKLDEEATVGRAHQGGRRRRRRQQRRQPHGARPASTASSSSSPTPICRRCSLNARADQAADRRKLTKGLGAGADPNVGRQAALEDTEKLIEALDGADMVFVTTGLGGGTGTGAAPVIASLASELGALTIAVVTKPFKFEGQEAAAPGRARPRGAARLRRHGDHDSQRTAARDDRAARTSLTDAFSTADDVLRQAIQGISDLILVPGLINLDFADVKTIMSGMGLAIMGTGIAEGEGPRDGGGQRGDLEPAARRRVGQRRARRDHQRHRRPGPVADRSERGVRRSSRRRRTRTRTSSSARWSIRR